MARPRLPTALKVLKGSLNVTRAKAHKDEPRLALAEVGAPPADLTDSQRRAWMELAPAINHLGVTTLADGPAFRTLVELRAEILETRDRGQPTGGLIKTFWTALGSFGMTPSDRSKVSSLRVERTEDPIDEFAGTG